MLKRRFKLIKQGLDDGAVLDDLNDVSASSPSNGQTIIWNGSAWVVGNISDIAGNLNAQYYTETEIDAGWYTAAEVDTLLTGYSATGHTHVSTDVTDFTEAAQDAVGGALSATGVGVDLVYDDGAGTMTANLDIPNLTAEATVDGAADYVIMYDASAGAVRKVLVDNLPTGSASPLTTKGDIYTFDTADARLPVGTDGQVLVANSANATGLGWATNTPTLPLTTKGDILGYDTGNARVPIGTDGQVLTADSTQALGLKWATPSGGSSAPPGAPDPANYASVYDDFFRHPSTNQDYGWWDANVSGTNALVIGTNSIAEHPGVTILRTGTSATGRAGFNTSVNANGANAYNGVVGCGALTYNALIMFPSAVPTPSTNDATLILGFSDTVVTSVETAIRYVALKTVNDSGTYRLVGACRDGSGESTTTVGSGTAIAADTWYHVRIVTNADWSSIEFFVGGSSIGTVTTNIPPTTDELVCSASYFKTSGTTSLELYIDVIHYYFTLASARWT